MAGLLDAPGELEESGAGGVDHGGFGGADEVGIGFDGIGWAEIFDDGGLGLDVAGDEICGVEFVEFWGIDADGIGIDGGTFEVTGEGGDHTGIDTTG